VCVCVCVCVCLCVCVYSLEMMEKIPKDKLEKFLNPTRAGVF